MNMKTFLVIAAALMAMNASARVGAHETNGVPSQPVHFSTARQQAKVERMTIREPGTAVTTAPRRAGEEPGLWYRRPAGAFPSVIAIEDGTYAGTFYVPIFMVKPYSDYTFNGFAEGLGPDASCYWEVDGSIVPGQDLTYQWEIQDSRVPFFCTDELCVQFPGKGVPAKSQSSDPFNPDNPPVIPGDDEHYSGILSVPNTLDFWGYDLLKSSKAFYSGNITGERTPMTYYSGAAPWGDNAAGWWFGKNGFHQVDNPRYFIDGIAQAFEKPQHPYRLKQVVIDCATLKVAADVVLTCRIYKLEGIPAYVDDDMAVLPEEPGELIARGHARVTPTTADETGNLIFFTLYDEDDGLEFEVTPTIDYPILVVFDGYNDPEMENLTDFTAMVSTATMIDEGFGELAYLKFGRVGEDGTTDYTWAGLNNFFTSGEMKTGLSIFLTTDLPYLAFRWKNEDGELVFPEEGGEVNKYSIEFLSWEPSADENWELSCNGNDVPEWLEINLIDGQENGEFNGIVTAEVVADRLPDSVPYREAVVRFEYSGAYIDYHFIQSHPLIPPFPCGPASDGELTISDVNYMIGLILDEMYDDCYDINSDGELNIADVNVLIDLILYD